jgi:ribosomal protein S18 acetylase RimI-like enzyme
MAISEDGWLSLRFGHPVYTVSGSPEELSAHMAGQGRASYQAKVPSDEVARVRALCEAGLYVVDAGVTLTRNADVNAAPSLPVVDAEPQHEPAVLAIAASAFHASRFHLDPAVSPETAARIKRDWVESYFRGTRGDGLLVALVDGAPAGFLAVLGNAIDLVATAPDKQGRGVGEALTHEFLRRSAGAWDSVQVGTQLANVGATRFYERLGFTTDRTQYVLHGHVGV